MLFPAPASIAAASTAVISALTSVGLTASVSKLPELAAGPTTLHFEAWKGMEWQRGMLLGGCQMCHDQNLGKLAILEVINPCRI